MVLKLTLLKDQALHVPQKLLIVNMKNASYMQILRNFYKKESSINVEEKTMTLYLFIREKKDGPFRAILNLK